jgi:cell division protease FtsH
MNRTFSWFRRDDSRDEGGVRPEGDYPSRQPQHFPPYWKRFFLFLLIVIGLQWLWLEAAHKLVVRTIAYSEFKTLLSQGRVVSVTLRGSEIVGKIRGPPPGNPVLQKAGPSPTPAAPTSADRPGAASQKAEPQNQASVSPSATKQKPSPGPQTFPFRTVRVDDPNLVGALQKAGVTFAGERPSFLSQFLWSWIVPLGIMFLVWQFVMRRLGGLRQGIMSFGASKAKLPHANCKICSDILIRL